MSLVENTNTKMHIAMYPLLAMGHLTPFLHLANKLAKQGHKTSFFVPKKTSHKLTSLNNHPNLITFIPIIIPHVEGLPVGAETTSDGCSIPLLLQAMDLTQDIIDKHLAQIKPDFVLLDASEWLPGLARKHGAKPIYFSIITLPMFAYCSFTRNLSPGDVLTPADFENPPPNFPSVNPNVRLHPHEAKAIHGVVTLPIKEGMTFFNKLDLAIDECDAFVFKSCKEIEGNYVGFVEKTFNKSVLLVGPILPEPQTCKLDDYFDSWLKGFDHASVVYCALGSECILKKEQFQDLVLGLELTGRPFLAALKPPTGYETVESALPEGFQERTKGKGIISGGWVQQQLILEHPSVGCFVTHCGAGSMTEALVSKCQIVMMPQALDMFLIARVMSLELRIGVEVDKDSDDGFIRREAVVKAINSVMDEESDVGREVRINHAKWRNLLLKDGLEKSYIDSLIRSLQAML